MNLGLLTKLATLNEMKQYFVVAGVSMVVVVALPFAAVGAMGQDTLKLLSAAPSVEAAETQGFYTGGEVPGDSYAWGNCTYWAFAKRLWAGKPIPTNWGNANTWDDNARAQGYVVDHTPTVGAVYQTDAGGYGHVAYVTEVRTDGSWVISEMNARGLNVVSSRTFNAASATLYTFIHDRKP